VVSQSVFATNAQCRIAVIPGTGTRGIFGPPAFDPVLADAGKHGCGTRCS